MKGRPVGPDTTRTARCRRTPHRWLALALLLLTAAEYAPLRDYPFLNYDDADYITEKPLVKAGLTREGFIWAWTGTHVGNWHPLTTCSHMLDCQLFGLNAGAHHLVNLLLHVLNTLLLFAVLSRATAQPWPSAVVAALFALHPLHVESVAWIAERKDVLSTFFWMLTLWAYLDYIRGAGIRRYAVLLAAYTAALLSKPMVVTLPFALLLLDVWPLGRVRGIQGSRVPGRQSLNPSPLQPLIEKLPLILMSAVVSGVTYVAQTRAEAVLPLALSPLPDRAANVLKSYAMYVLNTLWPASLAVYYPFEAPLPVWQVAGAAVLLLSISALVFWYGRSYPYLPVGWLWYVGTLVPVIGLVRAGSQARADRFTYVPSIGLFLIAAWGIPDLLARWKHRCQAGAVLAVSAIAACAVLTSFQLRHWRDSISLFQHALSVTPDNQLAREGLAGAYLGAGRRAEWQQQVAEAKRVRLMREAEAYLRMLEAHPDSAEAHFRLGRVRATQGEMDSAIAEYTEAIRLQPGAAKAHKNLGVLLVAAGRVGEGLEQLEQAVQLDPDDAEAYFNLGTVLLKEGRRDQAEAPLASALRIRPDYAEAHSNLGFLFFEQGRTAEAIAEYQLAVHHRDDFPEAHTNLGVALAAAGKSADAIAHFETALRLSPDHAAAHRGLGRALAQAGEPVRAITELETAVRLDPRDSESRQQLEQLRDSQRRTP